MRIYVRLESTEFHKCFKFVLKVWREKRKIRDERKKGGEEVGREKRKGSLALLGNGH